MHEYLAILETPHTKYELERILNKSQRAVSQQIAYLKEKGYVKHIGVVDKRYLFQTTAEGLLELKKQYAGERWEEDKPTPVSSGLELTENDILNMKDLKLDKYKPSKEEAIELLTVADNMMVFYKCTIARKVLVK